MRPSAWRWWQVVGALGMVAGLLIGGKALPGNMFSGFGDQRFGQENAPFSQPRHLRNQETDSLDYDGATVMRRGQIDGFPSASGIARVADGRWLVIGDDAPAVVLIDDGGQVVTQATMPAWNKIPVEDGRMVKRWKRDYEAVASWQENGQFHFIAFGSGGDAMPERANVLLGQVREERIDMQEIAVPDLFQRLSVAAAIERPMLNIEAATVAGDRLILGQREGCRLLSMDLAHLRGHLAGAPLTDSIAITSSALEPPTFADIQGGISGACTAPDGQEIFYSASIEDRENPILDGQILGSYIGIAVGSGNDRKIKWFHLQDAAGNRLFDKLESIEVMEMGGENGTLLFGVVDNDDGGSEWLVIQVPNWPPNSSTPDR